MPRGCRGRTRLRCARRALRWGPPSSGDPGPAELRPSGPRTQAQALGAPRDPAWRRVGSQGVPSWVLKTRRLWVDAEPLGPRAKRFRPCNRVLSGRSIWEQQGRRTPRPSRRVGSSFERGAGAPGPRPALLSVRTSHAFPTVWGQRDPRGAPGIWGGGPTTDGSVARSPWVAAPRDLATAFVGIQHGSPVSVESSVPSPPPSSARWLPGGERKGPRCQQGQSKGRAGLSVTSPFKVSFYTLKSPVQRGVPGLGGWHR